MNFEKSVFDDNADNLKFSNKKIIAENISLKDYGIDINDFKEEANAIEDLRKLKSSDNWKNVRSDDNFNIIQKDYSFGKRNIYVPKKDSNNVDLQSSRGVGFDDNETLESTIKKYLANTENMDEPNILRIAEIENIEKHIQQEEVFINLLKTAKDEIDKTALRKAFLEKTDKFTEIGFRVPSLLNFFKKLNYETLGYDINPLSISICKKLGWNVKAFDLNNENSELEIKEGTLIVCYHVLEHVSDPLAALKNIAKQSPTGVKLHFEIPIEPGIPRLQFGHMFPFEKGDLQKMLMEAGLIPVSFSNATHPGGPEIERILAISR